MDVTQVRSDLIWDITKQRGRRNDVEWEWELRTRSSANGLTSEIGEMGSEQPWAAELGNDTTSAAASTMAVSTFRLEVAPCRSASTRARWSTSLLLLYTGSDGRQLFKSLAEHTLLYFLISRTRLLKASSTLSRCLAEVSMNLQLKCLAKSRPSAAVSA